MNYLVVIVDCEGKSVNGKRLFKDELSARAYADGYNDALEDNNLDYFMDIIPVNK